MKQADVVKGGLYECKVSERIVKVRIIGEAGSGYFSKRKAWFAINLATNKQIKVSAARLRRRINEVDPRGDPANDKVGP